MLEAIADTSALVALLDKADAHHAWAVSILRQIRAPMLTCEAVLSETWHLLRRAPASQLALLRIIRGGALSAPFCGENLNPIAALLEKYVDVPMSFADACLVRMAEENAGARIWTLDSDFSIYRVRSRKRIPLISPLATN